MGKIINFTDASIEKNIEKLEGKLLSEEEIESSLEEFKIRYDFKYSDDYYKDLEQIKAISDVIFTGIEECLQDYDVNDFARKKMLKYAKQFDTFLNLREEFIEKYIGVADCYTDIEDVEYVEDEALSDSIKKGRKILERQFEQLKNKDKECDNIWIYDFSLLNFVYYPILKNIKKTY